MSLIASSWAMSQLGVSQAHRVTLYWLADYADSEGCGAYPSRRTLEIKTGSSESTIKRHLREFQQLGLIVLGDQELVSHYRADSRPKVWNLCLWITLDSGGSPVNAEESDRGVTGERGVTHDTNGGSPVTPKPRTKPITTNPPAVSGTISRAPVEKPPTFDRKHPAPSPTCPGCRRVTHWDDRQTLTPATCDDCRGPVSSQPPAAVRAQIRYELESRGIKIPRLAEDAPPMEKSKDAGDDHVPGQRSIDDYLGDAS